MAKGRMQPGLKAYILAYPDSFVKYGSVKEAEDRIPVVKVIDKTNKKRLIVYELTPANKG